VLVGRYAILKTNALQQQDTATRMQRAILISNTAILKGTNANQSQVFAEAILIAMAGRNAIWQQRNVFHFPEDATSTEIVRLGRFAI